MLDTLTQELAGLKDNVDGVWRMISDVTAANEVIGESTVSAAADGKQASATKRFGRKK